ncbi:MAG TPA: hypothetical protein VG325_01675 [Solirubrobacteraceae bacterium]|jgi:hypothetical protein|nr:hypothetical protein [Solirubrobacteraceae bacterium]
MGEVSDKPQGDYESFAVRWLTPIVTVFLRATRDAALAYDLTTETLAAARIQWASAADIRLSGLVDRDPLPHPQVRHE